MVFSLDQQLMNRAYGEGQRARKSQQQIHDIASAGYNRQRNCATTETDSALNQIGILNFEQGSKRNQRITDLLCNPDHSPVSKLGMIAEWTKPAKVETLRCGSCYPSEQGTHGEVKREWSSEWTMFIPCCRKHSIEAGGQD